MDKHGYKHQWNKQQGQWRNTHDGDPSSSKLPSHRTFQPFCNQVHAWNHDEGHKESKCQTEDDRPRERLPEYSAVTAKENMRIQIGEHGYKINVETDR